MRAFAQELGAGLKRELWSREDLDEAEVEALQKAESPIFLAPRQGHEVLYYEGEVAAYSFQLQSPKTMPSTVEDLEVAERALNAELDHHLACDEAGNSRNGNSHESVTTATVRSDT